MRRLDRPLFAAHDVLDLCIASIRDNRFSDRLIEIREQIKDAEAEYILRGQSQELFEISPTNGLGNVTANEMKKVYKETFAKSVRTRNIYDSIKKAPANDICPLCGQRTVGSLDHYLAQSLHSALVVAPTNLIPACADCNKAKLDSQPGTAAEQTLHPYFDNVDDEVWLYAQVEETNPASLRFYAAPPVGWPHVRRERVLNHFRTFGLGPLYASHSGVELINIQYGLRRISDRGNVEDIHEELLRRAESSRAAHTNSWQTAMYCALANSEWFCAGGFK